MGLKASYSDVWNGKRVPPELRVITQSGLLMNTQSGRMQIAIEAATLAREHEDWRVVATHSQVFHQQIVGLTG